MSTTNHAQLLPFLVDAHGGDERKAMCMPSSNVSRSGGSWLAASGRGDFSVSPHMTCSFSEAVALYFTNV